MSRGFREGRITVWDFIDGDLLSPKLPGMVGGPGSAVGLTARDENSKCVDCRYKRAVLEIIRALSVFGHFRLEAEEKRRGR